MERLTFLLSGAFILFFVVGKSQNNLELQQMADSDQNSRMAKEINWKILSKEDSLRREKVIALLKSGDIKTAKDHLNAGIIFQHGNDSISSRLAVENFGKAIKADSTLNRWWYAAAVDRDLMRRGKPQIYGTQYIKNKNTAGKWIRYTIDSTKISDKQRQYYRVETLAEQLKKVRLMNLKPLSDIYKNIPQDKAIVLIRNEIKKGEKSQYNVSEEAINAYGYELLNQNKKSEAIKIFKLNTEFYPTSWNTFDSYAEALLSIGKKKEAEKYYRKSLSLNPENDNAIKVLEKLK